MRSSLFDDYTNKTDTVIIDKKTGAVICAIDLVNDEAGGDRYKKKMAQFQRDAKTGGNLRFGLTVASDEITGRRKLLKKTLTQVPKFFLAVERPELDQLLRDLPSDSSAPATDTEKTIFTKFISSLTDQSSQILSDPRGLPGLKQNLGKFRRVLEKKII